MIYFADPIYLLLVVPLALLLLYLLMHFAKPPRFTPPSLRFYREENGGDLRRRMGMELRLWLLFTAALFCIAALADPSVRLPSSTISFSSFCIAAALIAALLWLVLDYRANHRRAEMLKRYRALVPRVPFE